MSEIKTYAFEPDDINRVREQPHGTDWPVVYLLENGEDMYIGETTTLYNRLKNHQKNPDRGNLDTIHYITDDEFNKSATLDIESWLIQYIAADGKYSLQNGNGGMQNHSYYNRQRYEAKFKTIWEKLQKHDMVERDLVQIKNSDLFKYSPYKSLTEEQIEIVEHLFESITKTSSISTHIIEGEPGTGKTILATYLIKYLTENEKTKDMKVGLVVPMGSLRRTLKDVFRDIPGLQVGMVINPGKVVGGGYDIVIVDEAHRLKQRQNIMNYQAFDNNNKKLGLGEEGTQLDWILMSTDRQILFYDEGQSIRPADIEAHKFKQLTADKHVLKNQMRVQGGQEYLQMVENFFDGEADGEYDLGDYDFQVYDDIHQMVADIKEKDEQHGLARMVAGYAWEWVTKNNDDTNLYDIEIDGCKLRWNSTMDNWVNSENAVNEVGCIHTVQGYDLNYAGIIVGPELSLNPETEEFVINEEHYYDRNGYQGIEDPEELKRYILNIYKTLFARGIKGAYVYFCDEEVENYFKDKIEIK